MPITPRPTSGLKFYVSTGVPATFTAAGYNALTWTEVPGMESVPGFGDSYNIGTFDTVSDGQFQYRGLKVAKQITTTIVDSPADAGQIIMRNAFQAAGGSAAETVSFKRQDGSLVGQAARGFVSDFTPADAGAGELQMRTVAIATIVNTTVELT